MRGEGEAGGGAHCRSTSSASATSRSREGRKRERGTHALVIRQPIDLDEPPLALLLTERPTARRAREALLVERVPAPRHRDAAPKAERAAAAVARRLVVVGEIGRERARRDGRGGGRVVCAGFGLGERRDEGAVPLGRRCALQGARKESVSGSSSSTGQRARGRGRTALCQHLPSASTCLPAPSGSPHPPQRKHSACMSAPVCGNSTNSPYPSARAQIGHLSSSSMT